MIRKKVTDEYELKILEVTGSDETGSFKIFMKDDHIKKIKIGQDYIIRNARIVIIKGIINLSCDENASLFEKNGFIKNINLEDNFSSIKVNCIEPLTSII